MDARLLVLLLAPLGLVACGPPPAPPDYQSTDGVKYYWKTSRFDPALIEEQETWFLGKLMDLGRYDSKKVMQTVSYAEVDVYGEHIACQGSKTGYCNGVTYGYDLLVRDLGCPFNSALTHEMAHLIRGAMTGDADGEHLDKPLWTIADGAPRSCP